MKHTLKLATALGIAVSALLGSSASAAPVGNGAVVTPAADDDPIYVLLGQLVVDGNTATGNADTNTPSE